MDPFSFSDKKNALSSEEPDLMKSFWNDDSPDDLWHGLKVDDFRPPKRFESPSCNTSGSGIQIPCDWDSSGGPFSSQASGNGVVMYSPPPSSGCGDRDITSGGIAGLNKTSAEMLEERNQIFEKRNARLLSNRETARRSRERKKQYVEELVEKVRSMCSAITDLNSTITDLNSRVSFVMAEIATLKQQSSAAGMCPPAAPGMYPHPPMVPMPYPWVPCAPYAVKPNGPQVPLVPIPRLKSQQPQSTPKAKKSENKKSEVRTKKVADTTL